MPEACGTHSRRTSSLDPQVTPVLAIVFLRQAVRSLCRPTTRGGRRRLSALRTGRAFTSSRCTGVKERDRLRAVRRYDKLKR